MEIPSYMHGRVNEILNISANAACYRENLAVILKLVPYIDGDKWCVLYGDNLQVGISGFGDSPWAAMSAFHDAMLTKRADSAGEKP